MAKTREWQRLATEMLTKIGELLEVNTRLLRTRAGTDMTSYVSKSPRRRCLITSPTLTNQRTQRTIKYRLSDRHDMRPSGIDNTFYIINGRVLNVTTPYCMV